MEFFLFIGALILCKVVYDKLQGRIETLTKELAALRMDVLNLKNGTSNSMLKAESSVALSAMEPKTTATMLKPSPAKTSTPPKPVLPRKSWRDSQLWKDLESQFAGNVTGVVGTLAVVLGIIFLGVYSAIQLDPIGRFGIVILFSLGLYAGYFFLSRKSFWKNISLWIRSAAGVTFLMGCLGSVGIDSMKWVSDPLIALGLLSLGLSANLVLGFLNGGEVFAAVHVIFSLFALALIPVNQVVFGIAALVAVVGILMSSKERHWDRNIMATVIGFSLLHFYWFFSNGAENFSVGSLPAIVMCLMVGMVALANHYRQTYQKINLGAEPLLAHILTWVTLGLNLLLHAHGSVWSSLLLALSSIVAFAISDRARKMQIHWLYVCDRIVSLLLSLFAVASLHKLGLSVFEISAIAVIVAAVFLRIAVSSFDEAIFNISNKVLLFGY
ncbi:MAG TPA: hypothetical protein VN132_13255, partial [Bdellovibrio sp.]|nr:hypothetical protein [Bdellovibrio sp.]